MKIRAPFDKLRVSGMKPARDEQRTPLVVSLVEPPVLGIIGFSEPPLGGRSVEIYDQ